MDFEQLLEADRIIHTVLPRDTPPRQAIMHMLRWWDRGARPVTLGQFISTATFYSSTQKYWVYQLVDAGWIATVEDQADRRRRIVVLTPEGEEYCEWLKTEFARFQQRERSSRMRAELRMLDLA